MDEPVEPRRRLRQRRRGGGDPEAPAPTTGGASHRSGSGHAESRRGKRQGGDGPGRGLRNLVGAGPSQLGVEGALRGRDVNRPTEEDLAEAEREVQIVRRNWRPRN